MSTPNPLAPQGSLLEKQARSKSTLQVAALIVGLHVFGLGGFLILGCKKEEAKATDPGVAAAVTNEVAAATAPDTNAPVQAGTNAMAAVQPISGAGAGVGSAVPAGTAAGIGTAGGAAPGGAVAGAGAGAAADAGAAAAAAAVPTGSASEYKVQKGDIAFNLAKKHNVTLKELQAATPNVDLKKLKVGATRQIPAPGAAAEAKAAQATDAAAPADAAAGDATVYHVKGGDSLGKIAKRHGTTVKAIRQLNGLTSDNIRVGQKLKLPAKSAAAAAAAAAPVAPETAPAVPASVPVASPAPAANGVPGAK